MEMPPSGNGDYNCRKEDLSGPDSGFISFFENEGPERGLDYNLKKLQQCIDTIKDIFNL